MFYLLLLGLHQLFLACYEHSFKTVHQPISCPATTFAQNTFVAPLLILWQNSILFVLAVYLYLWVQMDKDWATLLPTSLSSFFFFKIKHAFVIYSLVVSSLGFYL